MHVCVSVEVSFTLEMAWKTLELISPKFKINHDVNFEFQTCTFCTPYCLRLFTAIVRSIHSICTYQNPSRKVQGILRETELQMKTLRV